MHAFAFVFSFVALVIHIPASHALGEYANNQAIPPVASSVMPLSDASPPTTETKSFHKGIDISNPVGAPVMASESGVVISISPYGSGGNTVQIRNRDGSVSYYLHTKPSVQVEQKVYAGDVIGNTDMSGISKNPHIHYELHDANGKILDPMTKLPKS